MMQSLLEGPFIINEIKSDKTGLRIGVKEDRKPIHPHIIIADRSAERKFIKIWAPRSAVFWGLFRVCQNRKLINEGLFLIQVG